MKRTQNDLDDQSKLVRRTGSADDRNSRCAVCLYALPPVEPSSTRGKHSENLPGETRDKYKDKILRDEFCQKNRDNTL